MTEEQLGYPLPPLLRMQYGKVANGGVGLIWYDEDFPLIGARGGYPSSPVSKSKDGQRIGGPTIEKYVSRSGWRLHPCIEAALWQHSERYVVCSSLPDRFVTIMDVGSQWYALDLVSERVYASWFYGAVPLDNNQREPLLSLSFYWSSLEEMIEEYLAHTGCDKGSATRMTRSPGAHGELTPDLLDPTCDADVATMWRGLYRGVEEIVHSREPDDEW